MKNNASVYKINLSNKFFRLKTKLVDSNAYIYLYNLKVPRRFLVSGNVIYLVSSV